MLNQAVHVNQHQDGEVETPMETDGHETPCDQVAGQDFYKTLRQYQLDLAEPAIEGLNTVLVSPTGTGKTHVAAFIIDQHLNKLEEQGKKGMVVFLVPTVMLAEQQKNKLNELIGSSKRGIASAVGRNIDVNCSLLSIMEQSEVCVTVMTADVLLNGLRETNPLNTVQLGKISLLVVDECHNTQKEHSYNKVMKLYLRQKMGKAGADTTVPQVVAMTATLGTGGVNTTDAAMDHVFQICANLDAKVIQPVTNDADLKKFLNVPEDIGPIIIQPRAKDPFRRVFEELMKKIEGKISGILKGKADLGGISVSPSCPRDTQNYENWVSNFLNECKKQRESLSHRQFQDVVACLQNLKEYNRALCIHRDVRAKDAMEYLRESIKELKFRSGECNEQLIKIFQESEQELESAKQTTEENPLLVKIKQLLVQQFTEDPKSGALLMTRTRPYTKALLEWIKEDELFQTLKLNPGRVTGDQDPSMTKSERDTTLQNFRERKHNILVTTNVLEEGTDLPACNLVIRHNYVPSETGHTQVKGRGRAKKSKSFLVALSESRNFKDQELSNRVKEEWAKKVLDRVQKTSQQEVERRIKELQTEQWKQMWLEEQEEQEAEAMGFSDDYLLLCAECDQVICSSANIVRFQDSKYVVTASDFRSKCQLSRWSKPNQIKQNEAFRGKLYCKSCRMDWGSWVTVDGQNLPVIKITGFLVKNVKTGEVTSHKKWKKVPFRVQDVNTVEMEFDI